MVISGESAAECKYDIFDMSLLFLTKTLRPLKRTFTHY